MYDVIKWKDSSRFSRMFEASASVIPKIPEEYISCVLVSVSDFAENYLTSES